MLSVDPCEWQFTNNKIVSIVTSSGQAVTFKYVYPT